MSKYYSKARKLISITRNIYLIVSILRLENFLFQSTMTCLMLYGNNY